MKKLFALILAALMVLSLVACADTNAADSDKKYVQDKGVLVVGITDFAPMDYKDANGEWIGFDADMARAFAEYIGVKEVEFVEITWGSKHMELEDKNIDVVWNGMTLTDDVKNLMDCSNAYCTNAQVVVVKKDVADQYQTAEACKELNFAVEDGSAGEKAAIAEGFQTLPVDTQAKAVMEVAAETSDACVIDLLMAATTIGEGTSYPDLTYTVALVSDEEYGIGFRKGSDLVQEINAFLKKAYDDGTMLQIAETYGIKDSIVAQ